MKGDILKRLRVEKGLTQKEFANEIDISASYVRSLECGERKGSESLTEKIADYFKVSIDFLEGNEKSVESELTKFLNILIAEGLIDDMNNIDDKMQSLIMHYVRKEIEVIKEKLAQDAD